VRIRVNPWLLSYFALQFGRRVFDLDVAVSVGSGFHRKQTASMNAFKIAVRKFVSSLRILGVSFINAEVPFCILTESMETDKLILLICRRPISAPRAFVVRDNMSVVNESRCEREGIFV